MATLPWIKLATNDADVRRSYNERKGEEGAEEVRGVETRPHNAVIYRTSIPSGSNAHTKVVLSGQDDLFRFNAALIGEMYKHGLIE